MDPIFHDALGGARENPNWEVVIWRPSVYGILEDDQGRLCMIRDGRGHWGWELPGGGANMNETMDEALVREFYEETGYKVRVVSPQPLWFRENYVYSLNHKEYWHSLIFIYRLELASPERDAHVVNTVEKDEVEEMQWIAPSELTRENCHNIFWDILRKLTR